MRPKGVPMKPRSRLQVRKDVFISLSSINFIDALKRDTIQEKATSSSPKTSSVRKKVIQTQKPASQPRSKVPRAPKTPKVPKAPKTKNKDLNQPPKRRRRKKGSDETSGENNSKEKVEFICSACGTVFAKKEILQAHFIRKHTEGYNFSCDTCGKQFKLKGDLVTHIRLHHLEPPTVCDVCGKTYKNSLSLYVHQKYAHYKARFECQTCKRCLVTQENLDHHIAVMHGQRPILVCEECGKTFNKRVNLRRHFNNVHTNNKAYVCPVCSKAFGQTYHLRQHLLLHTGKRIYRCECGKEFAQKPGLLSHRKSHPGEHPPLPIIRLDQVLKEFLNKKCARAKQRPTSLLRLQENLKQPLTTTQASKTRFNVVSTLVPTSKLFPALEKTVQDSNLSTQLMNVCQIPKKQLKMVSTLVPTSKLFPALEKTVQNSNLATQLTNVCQIPKKQLKMVSTLVPTSKLFPTYAVMNLSKFKDSSKVVINTTSEPVVESDPLALNNSGQSLYNGIHIGIESFFENTSESSTAGKTDSIVKRNQSLQNEVTPEITIKKPDPLSIENIGVVISGMFKCKACDKLFKRKEALKVHYIRLHSNIHRYSCDECGEKFKLFHYLNRHKRQQHQKENLTENLQSSENSQDSPSKKKTRIRYKDLDESDRTCKICDKKFARRYSLKLHNMRVHTWEFKYRCGKCCKQFKIAEDLTSHMKRSHPGSISIEAKQNSRKRQLESEKIQQESTEAQQETTSVKEEDDQEIEKHSLETQLESTDIQQVFTEVQQGTIKGEQEEQNSLTPSSTVIEDSTQKKRKQIHKNLQLPCTICNKKFGRVYGLKVHHIRMHTTEFKFSCELCGKPFKLLKDLHRHQKCFHSKESPARTQRNSRKGQRKDPVQQVEEVEQVKNSTETPSSITIKKNPSRKGLFICEVCGKICTRKESLQLHITSRHSGEFNYTCADCGKEFKTRKVLCAHLKRGHEKQKVPVQKDAGEFYCKICGIKVLRKSTLKIHHLRKHTHQFKFSCKWCGKNFKVQGDLTTHTRLRHLEPPAVCEVCGKTCKNKHSLYVHQKYNHFKTKFLCSVCNKCFASQENLDQHMFNHEKKDRLTCAECGNTFATKFTLQSHLRCVHHEEKTFSCQVCGKLFPSQSRLRKHLLTHTGKRLFVCDICGKPFKHKPSLISHRKLHPGVHPPLPIIRLDDVLSEFIQK